jgi:ribosome-associated protein
MFVAKQLRNTDTKELEQYLENLKNDASQLTVRHHRAEAWRDFLLSKGDEGLAEFLNLRPDADRQGLRQLLRKATMEANKGKPPAAARSLFRAIREMDGTTPLPPCP